MTLSGSGTLLISVAGFAGASGTVGVVYDNHTTPLSPVKKITITGLSVDLGGVLTIAGANTFTFTTDGTDITVAASGVTVKLTAGVEVGATAATLALTLYADDTMTLSGSGTLLISVAGFAGASGTVGVGYDNHTTPLSPAKKSTITDLAVDLGGVLTIAGANTFTFTTDGTDITVAAVGVTVKLTAGVEVGATAATLALTLYADDTMTLSGSGTLLISVAGFAGASGTVGVVYDNHTTPLSPVKKITITDLAVDLGGVLTIAGANTFTFTTDGTDITVAAVGVTVKLTAGVEVGATAATLALTLYADDTMTLSGSGTLLISVAGFAGASGTVGVVYDNHTTPLSPVKKITITDLAVDLGGVLTIAGANTFTFTTDGTDITVAAVGVTVKLTAGVEVGATAATLALTLYADDTMTLSGSGTLLI